MRLRMADRPVLRGESSPVSTCAPGGWSRGCASATSWTRGIRPRRPSATRSRGRTRSSSSTSTPRPSSATPTVEWVRRTAEQVFIPLTVGGGVRSEGDARRLLRSGADKVGVNSAAVERPELRRRARPPLRQPVRRPLGRRPPERRRLGGRDPRRSPGYRSRRSGLDPRGRRTRRRRDPAHQHRPRRHPGRVRPRPPRRGGRVGSCAGHRLGRCGLDRALGRRPSQPELRRCSPPPSSTTGTWTVSEVKRAVAAAGFPVREELQEHEV